MTAPANDPAPLDLHGSLRMSLELLGLPSALPEPEVLKADLARIQCKSLAGVIARLIAKHEPLLEAEAEGATVTVREVGGDAVMTVRVTSE